MLCAPLVFYEALLLRDSLIAFAGLAIVWLTDRALASEGARRWFALGVALGLACLLKSSFLLFAAAIAAGVLVTRCRDTRPWSRQVVVAAAGLSLVFLLLAARNASVGAPAVSLASSGPLTFVRGERSRRYLPEVGFGIDAPVARATSSGTTDGGWRAAIARGLEGHSRRQLRGAALAQMGSGVALVRDPEQRELLLHADAGAGARVDAGDVLGRGARWRWSDSRWARGGCATAGRSYALVTPTIASLVGFYVLGRFRIALVAALLPFAGARRSPKPSGGCAVAATRRPRACSRGPRRRRLDRSSARAEPAARAHVRLDPAVVRGVPGSRLRGTRSQGHGEAAAAYLEFFARYEPAASQILSSGDPRLAPELADMHMECAHILAVAGEPTLASQQQEASRRILELRPLR